MATRAFLLAAALLAGLATPPDATIAATDLAVPPAGLPSADLERPGALRPLSDDEDPDEKGACIHTVSGMQMCNDITRGWCITGGFAKASFYPGETCASLKRQGIY